MGETEREREREREREKARANGRIGNDSNMATFSIKMSEFR